jgi:hypothetical protein
MAWKFDPTNVELIWTITTSELTEIATLDLGNLESDLSLDTGDRINSSSILDQGLRVVDGSF